MPDNKYLENLDHTNYDTVNEVDVASPKMQEILILNDDYTTADFVVTLLVRVFEKSLQEATKITESVHVEGKGSCGIYTYDIAELKYSLAQKIIHDSGVPLRIIIRDI